MFIFAEKDFGNFFRIFRQLVKDNDLGIRAIRCLSIARAMADELESSKLLFDDDGPRL